MHKSIAALTLALGLAVAPLAAQDLEVQAGAGVGVSLFDEHFLTYPTAEFGVTRWSADGRGFGARVSFQLGKVLLPHMIRPYGFDDLPPTARAVGVTGAFRGAFFARRRWFPRHTEIDVAIGWRYDRHSDLIVVPPSRRIRGYAHGGHWLTVEFLVGRRLRKHVSVKGGFTGAPVPYLYPVQFVGLLAIGLGEG